MTEQNWENNREPEHVEAYRLTNQPKPATPPQMGEASKGLAQMFGLDVRAAAITILVDLLIFSGDFISMGMLLPLGICAAGVLGFIVYRMQMKWYQDDRETALIKALVVALLTAIPAPITALIAIPAGTVGLYRRPSGQAS